MSKISGRTRLWLRAIRAEYWVARKLLPNVYSNDALICFNSHSFVDDPDFQRAYQRGARALGDEDWYQWQWRVHVGLWAASSASHLKGEFVECGVSYGFLSSAIMEYLDWDRLGKTFYLLDTFSGIDPASSPIVNASREPSQRATNSCATECMSIPSTACGRTSHNGPISASSSARYRRP